MDMTELFFDKSPSPKLIYTFEPGSDIENAEYRCERMNPAAEQWICDNACGKNKAFDVEAVFETWGVLADYRKILATARREGSCFSALFAHAHDHYVILDAFSMADRYIGLLIRRSEAVKRAFPLEIFLSISLDMLCIVDENGKFVRVNAEFSRLLGYEIADVEGMKIIDFVHPEDMPATLDAVRRLNEGEPVPNFINRYRAKSGEYRFLQWKSMPFPPYIIASARDITEAFSLSLSLEKEFTSDALTGAANRKFFEHEAKRLVDQFSKNAVASSLVMIDLDHFKRVNDTYGHPVGDTVLISLVNILIANCRSTDTVSRVGGEEFAVLLPGAGIGSAFTVAEKMREAVEAFNFETVGHVTASFGTSELFVGDDLQRWYTRADTALYLAKNNGRNCTVTSDMLYHSDERIEVMPWDDAFLSGNPSIDREHRGLLLSGKKLLKAYYDGDIKEEERRLEELFRLLSDHFTHEEQLLQNDGYMDLQAHREIHKSLLASVTFWKTLQSKERIRIDSFYGFLINKVIRDHLVQEDAKFFSLFLK